KRRDTKGFELLATQLFSLTRGDGEEWGKAQELGRQIDPENPLYQPGGRPAEVMQMGDRVVEPLGASTMPQSVLPPSSAELHSSGPDSVVDLDLDLDAGPASLPPMAAPEITQPFTAPAAPAPRPAPTDLSFELPPVPPVATPKAQPAAMDFDLDGLSLDLDVPGTPASPSPAAAPGSLSGFGDLELPDVPVAQPAAAKAS